MGPGGGRQAGRPRTTSHQAAPGTRRCSSSRSSPTRSTTSPRNCDARGVERLAASPASSDEPDALAWRFSPAATRSATSARTRAARPARDRRPQRRPEPAGLRHVVVNYDLPWAIIRLIQRAGRVDRIGQQAETSSATPSCRPTASSASSGCAAASASGCARTPRSSAPTRRSSTTTRDDRAAPRPLQREGRHPRRRRDAEVDLASYAYQIWKNAIDADPTLEDRDRSFPTSSTPPGARARRRPTPKGVLVYVRTPTGNDALAWIDREGKLVTESQLAILNAAACPPDAPALPARRPPRAGAPRCRGDRRR